MAIKQNDKNEESELVHRIICGQETACRELMYRYGQRVMSLVIRMVSEPEDAEELVQDTFIKAFGHIDTFDANKASLSTWLLQIAYNETINHLRRQKHRTVSLDTWMKIAHKNERENLFLYDESGKNGADGPHGSDKEERISRLEDAINRLSVEERTLLMLYYYDNLSMQEISHILNQKASTLSLRLFRIRRKLQNMIEKRIDET